MKTLILKFFLALLACFCCTFATMGQVDSELSKELTKEFKPTVKMLKKKYELKKATVIAYRDGYSYFLLSKKSVFGYNLGVADMDGNLIIPIEYEMILYKKETDGFSYFLLKDRNSMYSICNNNNQMILPAQYLDIAYYPALAEGVTEITNALPSGESYTLTYYHARCGGVFLAKTSKYSRLVDTNGIILRDEIKGSLERLPGYWKVGDSYLKTVGLLSSDGEVLVSPDYNSIFIRERACYFTREENGITYTGALALDNSAPIVPCMFSSIYLSDDNNWIVKRRVNDESEKFNPSKKYDTAFRDKGEELYEKGKYDEVIDFYAEEGIKAPWAKFFTAIAVGQNAYSNHVFCMEGISECIEKNVEIPSYYSDSSIDIELSVKQFTVAKQLLEAYMREDSTYYNQANSEHRMCDYYLKNMDKYTTRYKNALATLERRNAAEAARRREEAARLEAQRQRNAAIIVGILGGFTKALLENGSSSNSSSGSGKTYVNPSSKSSSGGEVSSSSSSSSSSPSSQVAAPKNTRTVKCKACGGTGLWVDERISGDEKYCERCGRLRKPHTHKTCGRCSGKGYYER